MDKRRTMQIHSVKQMIKLILSFREHTDRNIMKFFIVFYT